MAENKNELEKYIDFALGGAPEIKREEKRRWLGEFRERVIFALTYDQIQRKEAKKVVEEKIKDRDVKRIVLHMDISPEIAGIFMELAKNYDVDYRSIDSPELKGDIALLLASDDAVDREQVMMEDMPLLPDKFYHAKSKKLCKNHMEELKEQAPLFVDDFEEVTFFDKMVGIKCGVCDDNGRDGVLI
ncbi:MAG: YueI family protein [Thermotaleaceae bacterium]